MLDPTADGVLGRLVVKSGIDFDRRQIARVKFEPLRIRQFAWIKAVSPIRKTPGAGADANFLLVGEVQFKRKSTPNFRAREDVDLIDLAVEQ